MSVKRVFKEDRIDEISRKLNLHRSLVKEIIEGYIGYLAGEICAGRSVRVLNICYIRPEGSNDRENQKTLAYIATEVASQVGVGGLTARRVLSYFEERIVSDLKNGNGTVLRGLIRIWTVEENGITRLRVLKSTAYANSCMRVTTLNSFRRRVLGGG